MGLQMPHSNVMQHPNHLPGRARLPGKRCKSAVRDPRPLRYCPNDFNPLFCEGVLRHRSNPHYSGFGGTLRLGLIIELIKIPVTFASI